MNEESNATKNMPKRKKRNKMTKTNKIIVEL